MLENERQISQATSSLMAEERLVDEVEAALLALCAPPAMEALGGVWNLVALVDAPFFLARALLALVGDVQRHKSELTRFSIAETMNTVPVGALVVDAGGKSLLLNDSMRALLRDLGLPTDLGDLRGTWDGIARSARPARLSRGSTKALTRAPSSMRPTGACSSSRGSTGSRSTFPLRRSPPWACFPST